MLHSHLHPGAVLGADGFGIAMDHGQWLDKKYDVLNRGWAALPEDQRPEYWRKKLSQTPAA